MDYAPPGMGYAPPQGCAPQYPPLYQEGFTLPPPQGYMMPQTGYPPQQGYAPYPGPLAYPPPQGFFPPQGYTMPVYANPAFAQPFAVGSPYGAWAEPASFGATALAPAAYDDDDGDLMDGLLDDLFDDDDLLSLYDDEEDEDEDDEDEGSEEAEQADEPLPSVNISPREIVSPPPQPEPPTDTPAADPPPPAGESGPSEKAEEKAENARRMTLRMPDININPKLLAVLKKVCNLFFWVICIALVLGSILFSVSKDPRKNYLGYRTYSVKTESMTPQPDSPPGGFRKGDMIIVKICEPEDIREGDIITFNPSRDPENVSFLTHRVVKVLSELGGARGIFFVTRGDANHSDDPAISAEMLVGKKVFNVPRAGKLLQAVREHKALALVTIVSLFSCIILFRWYFAMPKEEDGKEKDKEKAETESKQAIP